MMPPSMSPFTTKPRTSQAAVPVNTQLERPPATGLPLRRDVEAHNGERESKKNRALPAIPQAVITTTATTTSADHDNGNHSEALPDSILSDSLRPPNAQIPLGHLPENEQQEMSEIRQPAEAPPPPPKDKYHLLKGDYHRMQCELELAHSDLEAHKHELRRIQGEMRSVTHFVEQLHDERQQFNEHIGSLQNELISIQQQLEDAKNLSEVRHENQRLKQQIGSLRNELSNVYQQLEEPKTLFGVRRKELFAPRAPLTEADTLSISEVGEKVTALNEQIFQAATTLREALIHRHYELSQEELNAITADSREMVGEKATNILISQAQKPGPEVNSLLVQVALQIFMVTFCVSKIQSYPSDSTIGEFLHAIYSTIRSSEEQVVSGLRRALTRAHTGPSTETWTDELSRKLMAVFKVAAWMPRSPETQDSFANRLPSLFKAVNELRFAIGEKFTSIDLDVSVFDSDTLYEPSYMEDAYGDSRQPNGKRAHEFVVGTTGIGLKKLLSDCDANEDLIFEIYLTSAKAKIVLESTLKEALKPVQSSGMIDRDG